MGPGLAAAMFRFFAHFICKYVRFAITEGGGAVSKPVPKNEGNRNNNNANDGNDDDVVQTHRRAPRMLRWQLSEFALPPC